MKHRFMLLVTGGRGYADTAKVDNVLSFLHEELQITHLIEGGADGADKLCKLWALRNGIHPIEVAALWTYYRSIGKVNAAGPVRNGIMVALQPDKVVAFPGGSGTANCVRQAREALGADHVIVIP